MKSSQLPLSTYHGYLKQIASEHIGKAEPALFDLLFPLFRTRPSSGGRPRRFAGYEFPKSKFYSIAMTELTFVDQTLAHELRAYRNPRDVGYIDVVDLGAENVTLGFEADQGIRDESINPENAIAVLVHDLESLPPECRGLCLKIFPSQDGGETGLFKFPYTIARSRIDGVVDLRLPHVRDWFFEYFAKLAEQHRDVLDKSPLLPETTIAYSRFYRENRLPPQRLSFWGMLPTLLNPDLGGGNPASTGSTILVVAHELRRQGANAFIYPSARADVEVRFERSVMTWFAGWNLVDYRGAARPNPVILDHSPWCWQTLPHEVKVGIADKGTDIEGSFQMQGMVNYSAIHYKQQCRAVRQLKQRVPSLFHLGMLRESAKPFAIWKLGTLIVRWLRDVLLGGAVEKDLLDVFALAVLFDVYDIVGRIDDLSNMKWDENFVNTALQAIVSMGSQVSRTLSVRESDEVLAGMQRLANNLELCLLYLACLRSWPESVALDHGTIQRLASAFSEDIEFLQGVDGIVHCALREFISRAVKEFSSPSDPSSVLKHGKDLDETIANTLLGRVSGTSAATK